MVELTTRLLLVCTVRCTRTMLSPTPVFCIQLKDKGDMHVARARGSLCVCVRMEKGYCKVMQYMPRLYCTVIVYDASQICVLLLEDVSECFIAGGQILRVCVIVTKEHM